MSWSNQFMRWGKTTSKWELDGNVLKIGSYQYADLTAIHFQ